MKFSSSHFKSSDNKAPLLSIIFSSLNYENITMWTYLKFWHCWIRQLKCFRASNLCGTLPLSDNILLHQLFIWSISLPAAHEFLLKQELNDFLRHCFLLFVEWVLYIYLIFVGFTLFDLFWFYQTNHHRWLILKQCKFLSWWRALQWASRH